MEEIVDVYKELLEVFEYARVEWENERKLVSYKRKESYWQGKKDGVRIALNLLHPHIKEKL